MSSRRATARSAPPPRRFILLFAGIVVLSGCGGGARVYSVDGRARMRIVRKMPHAIVEEGELIGAFDAKMILDISLTNGAITHFTLMGSSGSLRGSAALQNYNLGSPAADFEDVGIARAGTGAFADIGPSVITFKTRDNHVANFITDTVTGRLSDR